MRLWLLGALLVVAELTWSICGSASVAAAEGDSGIRGSMVSAWGNAPLNSPTYQCVRVFDATGRVLVANGTCSGTYGEFRIQLSAGTYVVEEGGRWDITSGKPVLRPERKTVEVRAGHWVDITPHRSKVPVQ